MLAIPKTFSSVNAWCLFNSPWLSLLSLADFKTASGTTPPQEASLQLIPGQSSHALSRHPGRTSALLCGSYSHLILIIDCEFPEVGTMSLTLSFPLAGTMSIWWMNERTKERTELGNFMRESQKKKESKITARFNLSHQGNGGFIHINGEVRT